MHACPLKIKHQRPSRSSSRWQPHGTGAQSRRIVEVPFSATFPARGGKRDCSMTDILQYIHNSSSNPRVWYWRISPHFILLVQSIYSRLYSMASICYSAPSACHPSTSRLQTARTLRSALVTTGQRRTKTQFSIWTTNYSLPQCPTRLWGSSNHLANGYRGFYTTPGKKREDMTTHHHPVHPVSRLWTRGAMPPLLHTFWRRDALLCRLT